MLQQSISTEVIFPSASDDAERLADWLELRALESADRNSAIQDLVAVIKRSGTTDGLDDEESSVDRGGEKSQAVAEDAFSEIDDRFLACGGRQGAYPFKVGQQYIQLKKQRDNSVYLFLLLLSRFGKDAGPSGLDAASVFEEICLAAAHMYHGGASPGIGSYHFGAPRRSTPKAFVTALNDMCQKMGEGEGCRTQRHNIGDQRDAKLDLVVWRSFTDGRPGQLISFGQCATGNNWDDKLSELQPRAFCGMWMKDPPAVDPLRLFFVPFRVEKRRWLDVAFRGGILFDRCRIAFHTQRLDTRILSKCTRWSRYVLKHRLRV
jgi:hypothetical protein